VLKLENKDMNNYTDTNAIIYNRCSTDDQNSNGWSIETQLDINRKYAAYKGLNVIAEISDPAISARKVRFADRPGGKQVLELLEAGKAVHLICAKIDRAFRNVVDGLSTAEAFNEAGITMHFASEEGVALSTSTSFGWLIFTQRLTYAEFEARVTSERTTAALKHLRENGKHVGKPRTGYAMVNGEMVETGDSAALREALEMRRQGATLNQCIEFLTSKGVKPARAKFWTEPILSSVLRTMGTISSVQP
jgi:DNA invertase Pin-like site-specific DNA recombinase